MKCILCAMCRDIQCAYAAPLESNEPELHWTCSVALSAIYIAGLNDQKLYVCDDHREYLVKAAEHPMKPRPREIPS